MANEKFKQTIVDNFDYTIDEMGNRYIALRKVQWGDSQDVRLDLRRYYTKEGGERLDKGFSFFTEEGPSELVHVLVKEGYGDTKTILKALAERENINIPDDEFEDYTSIEDIYKEVI